MDDLIQLTVEVSGHVYRRIQAEVQDTDLTPQEWVNWLIYEQFSYSASADFEEDASGRDD